MSLSAPSRKRRRRCVSSNCSCFFWAERKAVKDSNRGFTPFGSLILEVSRRNIYKRRLRIIRILSAIAYAVRIDDTLGAGFGLALVGSSTWNAVSGVHT